MTTLETALTAIAILQLFISYMIIWYVCDPVLNHLKQVLENDKISRLTVRAMTLAMQVQAALRQEDYMEVARIKAESMALEAELEQIKKQNKA